MNNRVTTRRNFLSGLFASSLAGGESAHAATRRRRAARNDNGIAVAFDAETLEIVYAVNTFTGRELDPSEYDAVADKKTYLASVSKVMALLCFAEWIREQSPGFDFDRYVAGLKAKYPDLDLTEAKPSVDDRLPRGLPELEKMLAMPVPLLPEHIYPSSVSFYYNFQGNRYRLPWLTLHEAITITLLQSTNDLVSSIDSVMGGTLVARMNQTAAKIGMANTKYINGSGLTAGGQGNYSTPRDQAKMMRYLEKNYPEFMWYMGQEKFRPQRARLRDNIFYRDPYNRRKITKEAEFVRRADFLDENMVDDGTEDMNPNDDFIGILLSSFNNAAATLARGCEYVKSGATQLAGFTLLTKCRGGLASGFRKIYTFTSARSKEARVDLTVRVKQNALSPMRAIFTSEPAPNPPDMEIQQQFPVAQP